MTHKGRAHRHTPRGAITCFRFESWYFNFESSNGETHAAAAWLDRTDLPALTGGGLGLRHRGTQTERERDNMRIERGPAQRRAPVKRERENSQLLWILLFKRVCMALSLRGCLTAMLQPSMDRSYVYIHRPHRLLTIAACVPTCLNIQAKSWMPMAWLHSPYHHCTHTQFE